MQTTVDSSINLNQNPPSPLEYPEYDEMQNVICGEGGFCFGYFGYRPKVLAKQSHLQTFASTGSITSANEGDRFGRFRGR